MTGNKGIGKKVKPRTTPYPVNEGDLLAVQRVQDIKPVYSWERRIQRLEALVVKQEARITALEEELEQKGPKKGRSEMPTGYTYIIDENENCTFRDFAINCAGNIEERVPSSLYTKLLVEAEQELKETEEMTEEAAQKHVEEEYAKNVEYYNKEMEILQRYDTIRDQVKAWIPPTREHNKFKEFMLEQLNTGGPCVGNPPQGPPDSDTWKMWKNHKIRDLQRRVAYYQEEQQKEIERYIQSNNATKLLLESLPEK